MSPMGRFKLLLSLLNWKRISCILLYVLSLRSPLIRVAKIEKGFKAISETKKFSLLWYSLYDIIMIFSRFSIVYAACFH